MAKAAASTAPAPLAPDPELPQYVVHDSKVHRIMRTAGFYGYTPCSVPTSQPWMEWEGGRIALSTWAQILAFFEWSQKEFNSETQVRLYYNKVTHRWATWAYPQRPNGMTTNEIADHPNVAVQRAQFPEPWTLLGTVHHHCKAGAFQSSTDRSNEETQEGIHITVGKIGSPEYDLHGRVVVRGCHFNTVWSQWFELPEIGLELPLTIETQIMEYFLKKPPAADTAFPETWKTNCERHVYTVSGGGRGFGSTPHLGMPNKHEIPYTNDVRTQFSPKEVDFMRGCRKLQMEHVISHTKMDTLVCCTSDPTSLPPDDKKLVAEVLGLANKCEVAAQRVDQLLDCWDFETTLAEIDRLNNVTPARTEPVPALVTVP